MARNLRALYFYVALMVMLMLWGEKVMWKYVGTSEQGVLKWLSHMKKMDGERLAKNIVKMIVARKGEN